MPGVPEAARDERPAPGAGGELKAAPAPRRQARHVTVAVMAVSALAALAMAWWLWPETRYALGASQPLDIGSFGTAELDPGQSGRYVRARIEAPASEGLAFRRWGEADGHRIVRVPGGAEPRFAEYEVPAALDGPRFIPPRHVAGRLVRVADLGVRHRGIGRALAALPGGSAASGWVLIDGEEPRALGWVLGLFALVCVFALWNLVGIVRVVRRVS